MKYMALELCALRFCDSFSLLSCSFCKLCICADSTLISLIECSQYARAMLGVSFLQMQTSMISDDPRQSKADYSHFANGKTKVQNGCLLFSLDSSNSRAFSTKQFLCWLVRDLWHLFWAMVPFLVILLTSHVSLPPGGYYLPQCFPRLMTFVSIFPTVSLGRLVPLDVNRLLIKKGCICKSGMGLCIQVWQILGYSPVTRLSAAGHPRTFRMLMYLGLLEGSHMACCISHTFNHRMLFHGALAL